MDSYYFWKTYYPGFVLRINTAQHLFFGYNKSTQSDSDGRYNDYNITITGRSQTVDSVVLYVFGYSSRGVCVKAAQ